MQPRNCLCNLNNNLVINGLILIQRKIKSCGHCPYEQLITLLDDDSNFSNLKLVHINGKEQYVFIKPLSDYLSLASTGYLAIMVSKEDVLSSTRKK